MDHSASKIGAIRGEKTGLVTTQIEWIELVGGLPEQDLALPSRPDRAAP
ncbi:hypothetical protein LWV33_02915 [Brucella intermedia]